MANPYPWLRGLPGPQANSYPYVSAKGIQAGQNYPVTAGGSTGNTGQLGSIDLHNFFRQHLPPGNPYGQYGDPAILAMIRQQLEQDLGAREHQNVLAAQLASGGDPYLGAYAGTQSRLQGQGALARAPSRPQLPQ